MEISEDKVCIESLESLLRIRFLSLNLNINGFYFCILHLVLNLTTFLYIYEKPEKPDRKQKVRHRLAHLSNPFNRSRFLSQPSYWSRNQVK